MAQSSRFRSPGSYFSREAQARHCGFSRKPRTPLNIRTT
jgi:hypothetical protein